MKFKIKNWAVFLISIIITIIGIVSFFKHAHLTTSIGFVVIGILLAFLQSFLGVLGSTRIVGLAILVFGFGVAYFVYSSEPKLNVSPHHVNAPASFANFPFRLGLDLSGGSHLLYQADTSKVAPADLGDQMSTLRDVLERRVNSQDISGVFGVAENSVRLEGSTQISVELPGVTNTSDAIAKIGQTPLLEFRTQNPNPPKTQNLVVGKDGNVNLNLDDQYVPTELTGRYLSHASLEFDQTTGQPIVSLQFNSEGSALFEKITKENIGKQVAIFLDGSPISIPTVREAISGGKAQISGTFTIQEAKSLVARLNYGALPMPISLVSTQTIGASLGADAITKGAKAAVIGFIAIAIFLIFWYRLSGIIAVIALSIYVSLMLALFKFIPVTLTVAGIAGFIISLGLAVDANVLIFERIKEELKNDRTVADAIHAGFSRAWFSIRDSNTSTIITAVILFWGFGTPLIKGFALTLGLGVLVSMLSAITVSRIFLYSLGIYKGNRFTKFLLSAGFSK